MCERFNNFVSEVQTTVENLNLEIEQLKEEIQNNSANLSFEFTFDILDGDSFEVGEIPVAGILTKAIISGVDDPSTITFSNAGNNYAVDAINDLGDSFELIFSSSNPDIYATDILEGVSTDFPYTDVSIELFIEQY